MEIIPAIDLIEGACVRLAEGDFSAKKIYSREPLEMAKRFESAGLKRLHIVDLDGARSGRPMNLAVLEQIAAHSSLVIDYGGGIKTDEDLSDVFSAGAAMANIGSTAAREPERFAGWVESFGAEKILLGADVRDGRLAIDGWLTATPIEIVPFLHGWVSRGITQAFVTDIRRDGLLAGPSTELYSNLLEEIPGIELIASGGIRSAEDLRMLDELGCSGAIIGKAIYEGRLTLSELENYAG